MKHFYAGEAAGNRKQLVTSINIFLIHKRMNIAMSQISSAFIFGEKLRVWLLLKIVMVIVVLMSMNFSKITARSTPPTVGAGARMSGSIAGNGRHVTRSICLQMGQTIRARHKSCFLRPDTGPCRADIVQWYYDVKQRHCYRFFWGGCQGNGNRFETQKECSEHCYLNQNETNPAIPHFCSNAFDYGTCFGHYYRWAWDSIAKACKRRLYSGCGGNQNNFHSLEECRATCVTAPRNEHMKSHRQITTCVPLGFEMPS